MDELLYKGSKGIYHVSDSRPFAFGRSSVLFIGKDSKDDYVCIKLFREPPETNRTASNGFEQFNREIQAQKVLSHPNILPILDYGYSEEYNSSPFIVMPLCEAGDLRGFMKMKNYFPFNEVITLLEQIASAIDYIHRTGFIHGDIKPENILFHYNFNTPYLSDLGISKYFPFYEKIPSTVPPVQASSGNHGTGNYSIRNFGAGTTTYLSPEQIKDDKISPLSDIYSFTMVAYEMLTGHLPVDIRLTIYRQMSLKVEGKIMAPIEINHLIDKKINNALLKGLDVNPSVRPRTASMLCQIMKGEIEI